MKIEITSIEFIELVVIAPSTLSFSYEKFISRLHESLKIILKKDA